MSIDWTAVRNLIADKQRFVLTTHVRPDADALGSELAMAAVLRSLGKQVRIINASATPNRLAFMDPDKEILHLGEQVTEADAGDADVHLVLDTSAWGQLAEMGRVFKKAASTKIVIDHHVSSDSLGAYDFKDVTAEATGSLVFEAANAWGVPITTPMANALWCAIATDTGWFRFPSTTHRTLVAAGQLMLAGAVPCELYRQLYEQASIGRKKLAGRVLSRIKLEFQGRVGWTYVRFDDYAETGSEPADTEDMVNECLTIAGVEAAFITIEQSNHQVKVSFRSRSHLDVASVAEKFNGGGHKQAAGAILPGPLTEAQQRALQAIETLFP
jgi:phosphoesterase RecJ-like protein